MRAPEPELNKVIYILEDDLILRKLLCRYLSAKHYTVYAYENIQSFMEGLKKEMPDVFLLDVHLPDGNGFELAEGMARNGVERPVLMMSANPKTVVGRWWPHNLRGFFSKPFHLQELMQKIEEVLT